jgi:hypothetical protein
MVAPPAGLLLSRGTPGAMQRLSQRVGFAARCNRRTSMYIGGGVIALILIILLLILIF